MSFRLIIITLVLLAGCARFQPRPISSAETAAHFEGRTLDNLEFKAFLEKNLQRKFDVWPPKSWDFEILAYAAYYYHPSLAVARAQWQVTLGGETTAAQRPNPTINMVPGYDFTATSIGINPWIPIVSIDVPIETAGKRGYRKAQASHLSDSARLNIATTAWQVRSNLRASLIDFIAARQREALLEKQTAIQERLVHALDQQLQVGAVSNPEVTLMQIALARSQLDLADARRLSADARVRVADAIGVSVRALDNFNLAYDLSGRHPAASGLMSTEVREQALRSRSDILVALANYAASQSALQLEIAKQYPDIHLGPGYQFNNGDHQFFMSLTAELPILSQNQGPIAEAEARRSESAAHFTELQAKVITEIDRAVAAYRVTQENLAVLESFTSAQKRQTETVEAQMKVGAADQLALMNSQIELGASELVRLDGQMKAEQAFGALEDAMQRPVDTIKPSLIERRREQAKKENKP